MASWLGKLTQCARCWPVVFQVTASNATTVWAKSSTAATRTARARSKVVRRNKRTSAVSSAMAIKCYSTPKNQNQSFSCARRLTKFGQIFSCNNLHNACSEYFQFRIQKMVSKYSNIRWCTISRNMSKLTWISLTWFLWEKPIRKWPIM